MRPNQVRQKLAAGQLAAGPFVFLSDPHVVGTAAAVGFDFVCICLEHGRLGFETLQTMIYAADAAGIEPFVRVSDVQRASVLRALECGARGILLPWCESAETARELVRHSRYQPLGARGAYTCYYGTDYARSTIAEHMEITNRELMVMVQIESQAGVDACESIAAVEGIDVLMIGAGDLSIQLGLAQQYAHPTVLGAMDRVVEATLAAGKQPAMLDLGPELVARYVDCGVKLWWWGQDLNWLRLRWIDEGKRLRDFHGWVPNEGRQPGRSPLDG